MLASATGDMMSDQLKLDVTFGWDTESQARIDAEKKKVGESIEHLEELGEQVEKEQEAAAGGTQNNTAAHDGEGTEPVTGNAPETDAGGGGSDDTGGDDANAEK